MRSPEIAPGQVEQALYTWSSSNLSGEKGQGFTAASPALRERIEWLTALDLSAIAEFEPGVTESKGFSGWRKMTSVGVFDADPYRVVYRKIASVGKDGFDRNRSAIHLLIARAEDLDFASISDDDPYWLGAKDCPLDRPPQLEALDLACLRPRQAAHECAEFDATALELLRGLTPPPYVFEAELGAAPEALGRFANALLTAVPTQLWSAITLDCRVGSRGPIARVEVADTAVGPTAVGRAVQVGLGSCELHRMADRTFDSLPPSMRTWTSFAAVASGVPAPVDPHQLAPERKRQDQRPAALGGAPAAIVGAATATGDWDRERPLDEAEASRALRDLGEQADPGWLCSFSASESAALMGGIGAKTVGRSARSLDAPNVSTTDLIWSWQETGLAVAGAALLARIQKESADQDAEPRNWQAVPKRVDADELVKLVTHLAATEKGLNQLAIFLAGGFLESERPRQAIIAAIIAVDPRPRFLFETVLDREQLDPHLLVPVLREELERFAEWKNLGPGLTEALRLGLREHRNPFERLISQLRRGGGPAVEDVEPGSPTWLRGP